MMYTQCEEALVASTQSPSFVIRVSGSKERGISLDEHVLEARMAIEGILSSWARLVADERGIRSLGAEDLNVAHLARFLLAHLDWMAAHPAATDFAQEIHDLTAKVRRSSQVSADLSRMHLSECVVPGCPGTLGVRVGRGGKREIWCELGHTWTAEQWLLLSRQLNSTSDGSGQHRRVSTRDAAIALGVGQATIRQWVRRGKLSRYGSDFHAEYELDELTALAEARSHHYRRPPASRS